MILIDALNIRHGGGKVLLDYLVEKLEQNELAHHVLRHDILISNKYRSIGLININPYKKRTQILRDAINEHKPKTILCFGNFPLPQPFDGDFKVVTFLQNALLLKTDGLASFTFMNAIKFKLKKWYFGHIKNNTHYYVVQTDLMKSRFLKKFHFDKHKVLVLPFFDQERIELIAKRENIERHRDHFIYPSSPQYHKNHEVLLEAWELLLEAGYTPKLSLTLADREETKRLMKIIDGLNDRGAKIENIGFMSPDKLYMEIKKCSVMVYPSLEETIGLSLVEATILGTDTIVSELPYYKPVIKPSLTFDPYSSKDIAIKVKKAFTEEIPRTELVVKNHIDEFIELLEEN